MKLTPKAFQDLQDKLQEAEEMVELIRERLKLRESHSELERVEYWKGKVAGLRFAIATIEDCNH